MHTPTPPRLRSTGFYRFLKWASLVTVFAVIAAFGTIGYNASPRYYLVMITAVLPLGVYVLARDRERKSAIRLRARGRWAKPGTFLDRPPVKDEAARRAQYLAWTREEDDCPVDERTWADLGMDEVTKEMDVCFTEAGRNELYRMLHYCLVSPEETEARASLVKGLVEDRAMRERLLTALSAVGQERDADPAFFLWADKVGRDRQASLYIGMGIAAAVSIASLFVLSLPIAAVFVAITFISNMWLYYSKARHLSSLIPSLRVLSRVLQAAAGLATWKEPLPGVDVRELAETTAMVRKLRGPFRWLLTGSPGATYSLSGDLLEVVTLYLKMFFVVDLIAFDRIASVIARDLDSVRGLYRAVGRLDALQAVASYRVYRSHQCVPEHSVGAGIEAAKLYHPLLKKPVGNSVAILRPGAVVTGTNMAGKSTFLRTLGINAILAQTTGACFAQSYRADRFLVMSSIEKHDDLGSGKSFYYDEAERIYRMLEQVGGEVPVLLLIDELLSGTNSLERVSASVAILHFLARQNALTVAATHDVAIASRLAESYPPFYFTDHADENGLSFDYRLRPGIVQSRNAIKLLSLIGYPDDVIEEAMKEAGGA